MEIVHQVEILVATIKELSTDTNLTTFSIIPNNLDYDVLKVISAKCVLGMNIF